ncbi:MAG TPA: HAMP domain-containing sensor histidine kinase [Alphaproteobacteria bacterium]|nr:HAMP domain-containing sensor histidine kinase [Alphaproteobacteria bacterium]
MFAAPSIGSGRRPAETGVAALDLLRLRFRDTALEDSFREVYFRRSLSVIRISLLLGIVLVSGFAILDLWIVGDALHAVYLVRFGLIDPTLFALFLFTFSRHFQNHMQAAVAGAMLVVGLGVIGMTTLLDQPGSYLYYAGILDTVIYCCCIMRLRFYYALAVTAVLFAAYQFAAAVVNPIPDWALLNNNFFFVTATGVAAFAAYVQEFYLRLAHHNETLLVRERDRSQELLATAQAASQAKSDFLAMVSHELRTPLNAIIGFSEIMEREIFGALGDRRYVAYVEDIRRSGAHLLDVINDILDLSKAEAGHLELNEEVVNVRLIVDTVTRLMAERAGQKDIVINCEFPGEAPMLRADRSMVTRIVMNLVTNAIKFTDQGGRVDVSAAFRHGEGLVLTIADTGCGIDEADLERVMEPFLQADSSLSRKHEGTGLGLPLTRKMVELHGGRLELASIVGEGTTVRAIFPEARLVDYMRTAAE